MQQFNIELDAPSTPLVLYAMQADSLSRFFQMTITQGGTPWTPPTGAIWTVRFGAPNMPAGWYDTITEVGGSTHPAVVVSDNVAVVEIAEQAVSMAGQNILCVLVTDATGYQIASWQFQLSVTAVPGYDAPEVTVYYNALTEQVAQVLNSVNSAQQYANNAAESATLSQSWAVGNTGLRDGENTNNAQYWSQQAKQSAQDAVGFRTMQGGAVLPIDGDIDLTQPYPTKTGGSLTVTSAANRIDSVTINGFTTQTGSGDASPSNVRKIENAGMRNKFMTVTGNTDGLFMSSVVPTRVAVLLPDAVSNQTPLCDAYKGNRVSQTDKTCYIDSNKNFGITDSRFSSLEEAKRILNEQPVTFSYLSTEDTGKYYTGIEVEQGESYHCDIVELKDGLHSGDKLDTNTLSEFDLEYTFDGTEAWSKASETYEHCWRLFVQLNLFEKGVQGSNDYPSRTLNQIYTNRGCYVNADTIFFNEPSANTAEEFKAILAQKYAAGTPVKLFAKSQAGGEPKNIKQEKHARKTYVFTGTENIQKSTGVSGNAYYVNISDVAMLSSGGIVCNQAPTLLQSDLFNSTDWGVSLSSSFNGIRISAPYDTVDALKAELATLYEADNPFTVEYTLAVPEVYADAPVEINNPQGTYSVSGESGTTCQVFMEPLQNGGDANTLNGNTWADIPVQSVNSKTGAVQLNAADVSALPLSGGVYSTSAPVNTGKVWIDGSPIYRQVFSLSSQQLPQLQYTTYIPLSSFTGLAHFVDVKAQLFIQDNGSVTQYPIILPAGLGDSVIDVQTSERGVELYRVQLAKTPISPNVAYPSGNTNDIVFIVEYSKIGG